MPDVIQFVEVGPRDGLQNEAALIATEAKLALIRRAIAAGVRRIEVTSFVNPAKVPQMADAVLRIGDSMAKLEARPELSTAAAAYTEHLAKDWPPDKVAEHTAQMAEMHDFFTEVIKERADVAAALLVTERIAREHAEVTSIIQMAMLGTLASVVVMVSLMLLARAPIQVQAVAVAVLAAGLVLFIFFARRTLLRIRGIGIGALPPP